MQDEISEEGGALIRNHLSKKLIVYFVSPQETLENNDEKIEDFSDGDIAIKWVTKHQKTNKSLRHKQPKKSGYTEIVVEVAEIVDKYSLYTFTSIIEEKMLIEFEHKVDFNIGDRIFLEENLAIYSAEYLDI